MMPIVAGAVIGGLSKFSEVMRDQAASPPAPAGNAAATPYAAWADMMRTMLGGSGAAAPTPQAEPAAPPGGSSPVDAWADMIRTMTGQAPVAPEPAPAPAPPQPKPEGETLQAAWSDALDTGRKAQEQYLATLQNIFDQFWGAPPGRG